MKPSNIFRRERARLKEEHERREDEERLKQAQWEAEAELYRRLEGARGKAEQLLPTLSEERRNALYDEARADYAARRYKAVGSVRDKILNERVIDLLAKRILAEAEGGSS